MAYCPQWVPKNKYMKSEAEFSIQILYVRVETQREKRKTAFQLSRRKTSAIHWMTEIKRYWGLGARYGPLLPEPGTFTLEGLKLLTGS